MTDLEQVVKEADVVCFELMGTLVERRVCRPEDVFRFAQECFNDRSGRYLTPELAPHRVRADQDLRGEALRAGRSPESVGLGDIYDRVAELMDLDQATADLLVRSELEAERHVIRARPVMAELATFAAEQGKRVIVVGDTHLPRSFVEDLLAGLEVPDPSEVLLSSETGRSIAAEATWSALLRRHPGRRIAFVGATADAADAAGVHGVDAVVLRPSAHLYRHQAGPAAVLNGPMVFRHLEIDGWRLKNVHRSMVNALVAARVAADGAPSPATIVGYGALGPLVTGFVQWIHREASRSGGDRLVFEGPGGRFLESAYRSLRSDSALPTDAVPDGGGVERAAATGGRPFLVSSGWDFASGRWIGGQVGEGASDAPLPRLTFGIASGQEAGQEARPERAFVDGGRPALRPLADDLLGVSPGLLQCALAGAKASPDPDGSTLVGELQAGALDFVADFATVVQGLPSTLAVVDHQTSCETTVMLLNFPGQAATPLLERCRRAAGL